MADITQWAKQEKKRVFLGEFGVSPSPDCMLALQALLESMQDKEAWLGWTYWSAGPWWGNYPFSIQPTNSVNAGSTRDTAQASVLRSFLAN